MTTHAQNREIISLFPLYDHEWKPVRLYPVSSIDAISTLRPTLHTEFRAKVLGGKIVGNKTYDGVLVTGVTGAALAEITRKIIKEGSNPFVNIGHSLINAILRKSEATQNDEYDEERLQLFRTHLGTAKEARTLFNLTHRRAKPRLDFMRVRGSNHEIAMVAETIATPSPR